MIRVSNISSPAEFDLEQKRENLRDRRWQRRCKVILAIATLIGACGLGFGLPNLPLP